MHISFSQINYFLECPHKYKLLVIDKVKFPKTIELILGSLIHQSLQFLYSQNLPDSSRSFVPQSGTQDDRSGKNFPSLDELLRFYQDSWPKKDDYAFVSDSIEAIYFAEGAVLLSNFYRENYSIKPKIIDLESHFEIPLEDEDGETHLLTGVIDRIDDLGNGKFEIIDYKTSKIVTKKESLDDNLQLSIYHLALIERYPNIKPEDIKLSLYFLRTGNKITTIKNQNNPQNTKETILSIIKEIQASDFSPTTTRFCRYLPYKLTCPMWQHLYKEEKTIDDDKINDLITEFFKIRIEKTAINTKINEIKQIIINYMEAEKLGRVFGDAGYFSKSIKKNFDYDLAKLELELRANNLWDQVLSFDEKKLEILLETLPGQLKNRIIGSKIFTGDTVSLKSTKTKIKKLDD